VLRTGLIAAPVGYWVRGTGKELEYANQYDEKRPASSGEVAITSKLTKDDYQHFVPEVEGLIKKFGKIRLPRRYGQFPWLELGRFLWGGRQVRRQTFRPISNGSAFVGEEKVARNK